MRVKRIFSAIVLVTSAVRAADQRPPSTTPLPADETVRAWITQLHNPSLMVRRRALRAPVSLGTNRQASTQALVNLLADPDPRNRRFAADAIGEYQLETGPAIAALVRALGDRDAEVREHAAIALGKIGSPAIPRLLALVRTKPGPRRPSGEEEPPPTMQAYATFALDAIGPASVRAILRVPADMDRQNNYEGFVLDRQPRAAAEAYRSFLRSPDEKVQLGACQSLSDLEEDAEVAVPELIHLLQTGIPKVRLAAASALENIGLGASAAVPSLIATLGTHDVELRKVAVGALGRISGQPGLSVPALTGALNDPDGVVVYGAVRSLESFGSSALSACPAVRSILRRTRLEEGDVSNVLSAIPEICTGDRATIDSLLPLAANPAYGKDAVVALSALGIPAIPDLIGLYRRSETEVRSQVVASISRIDPPTPAIISLLADALADSDAGIAHYGANALAAIGPRARSAVPELIREYRANRNRSALDCALGGIGPAAAEALPVLKEVAMDKTAYEQLVKAVDDAEGEDDCNMQSAFEQIGPASIPVLLELLGGPHIAQDSLRSLLRLGAVPGTGAPSVAALLRDENDREVAAKLLVTMGDSGLAELTKATQDPNPQVRAQGMKSIGEMDRPCDALLSVGRPLLHDPFPSVRIAAGGAIAKCPEAASQIEQLRQDPDPDVQRAFQVDTTASDLLKSFLRGSVEYGPRIGSYIRQLGDKAGPYVPLVRRALASRDEELARDAAQLLEDLNAVPDDEAFRSLLQDSFVASYMDDAMGAIQQGTGETSRRKKAGRPDRKLPDLPWPVPKPSRMDVIHKELFGKEAKTLGDV